MIWQWEGHRGEDYSNQSKRLLEREPVCLSMKLRGRDLAIR